MRGAMTGISNKTSTMRAKDCNKLVVKRLIADVW